MSRRKKPTAPLIDDPFAEREAQNYDEPVPSREALLAWLEQAGQPLKLDHLIDQLGLADGNQVGLKRRLRAMVRDGQLIQNRRGGYGVAKRMDLISGRVIGHPDGYGFVARDEGGDDLYLRPKEMRRVLHGDRVLVNIIGIDRRGRAEGGVVEILERANQTVVGRFLRESGLGFVVPDDRRVHQDILIPPDKAANAVEGDYVEAAIEEQPDRHHQPIGRVTAVLGRELDAPLVIEMAIRGQGLPHQWPAAVSEALDGIPETVAEDALTGRTDLRELPLVTIDGADAKDFDDAVYCEPTDTGWKLIVAIADVSHYVQPGSALDAEARKRATSVYFPGRVVPMLPEVLSNGICSLNPDVDRLCMACQMSIDRNGRVRSYRFFEAVMRSHARLTYDAVWQAIGPRRKAERTRFKAVIGQLDALHDLYQALRLHRERRGALDFDRPEVMPQLDGKGQVVGIQARARNDAHRLIEECMIAANVAAAKFLAKQNLPAPYRVHEAPPEAKLEELKAFVGGRGLRLNYRGEVRPEHVSSLLAQARSRPDSALVEAVVLRAQSLAVYQPKNVGHFGLALTHYAHFTSPIRRYADLLVHRAIRAAIRRAEQPTSATALEPLCRHISEADRRAEDASRQVVDRLNCMYMEQHIGAEFGGTITGVTSFGVFVELDEIYVSGLIHVTALPADYYHFDPQQHELVGERRKRRYRLADRVNVRVLRVDADERKIDLELAR